MNQTPVTPFKTVGGLYYFARMLDKIRLHARGELRADFHENMGIAFDGRCCSHLAIEYPALKQRVLAGGTDEEVLEWCQQNGRKLTANDVLIWNGFCSKRGWRDDAVESLAKYKAGSGLGHRDDLLTFFDYYEVDEDRAK